MRSSFGVKGLVHHAGIIDSGYKNYIKVLVSNLTCNDIIIEKDTRFA